MSTLAYTYANPDISLRVWRRRGDVGPSRRDCGDACAASGECALLRDSKLAFFDEADEPMERISLDDEVSGCVREGVALGLGHRGRRRRRMPK